MTSPCPIFDNLEYLQNFDDKLPFPNAPNLDFDLTLAELNHGVRFLKSYRGSPATFNAYRRELERLFQWAYTKADKQISGLKREDIEDFVEFCIQPPKSWIGFAQLSRFVNSGGERVANKAWRPFVASVSKKQRAEGHAPEKKNFILSQAGIKAIFATLSSFYNYLIQENFLEVNPVAQIRQKSKFLRKQHGAVQIRRLSELQWAYVIETAQQMATTDPATHERTLFIMSALYGMYLRISELCSSTRWEPQMGHFYRDQYNHWWFKTVGKGNKERDITVSDAMLAALKRYRCSLGLAPLPSPGETTPLLPKTKGYGGISDTRYVRRIVQNCFDNAVARLKKDNLLEDADQLMSATVHWLRHTGISEDVKVRPREHVRDDAGHSSGAITDRYIDIELIKRHQSGKKKTIVPDA